MIAMVARPSASLERSVMESRGASNVEHLCKEDAAVSGALQRGTVAGL
jgi:hypothetical protein